MTDKEASDIIEEALNRVLSSIEDFEEGDILTDWVLVAYAVNPDKEKGGSYPTFYSNGMMPDYKVRGLLSTAMFYNGIGLLTEGAD